MDLPLPLGADFYTFIELTRMAETIQQEMSISEVMDEKHWWKYVAI